MKSTITGILPVKQRLALFSASKSSLIVEIITFLFILFFAHSAASSYFEIESLKSLLGFYTYDRTEVAWAIILVETVVGCLLIFRKTRAIGLFTALLFMSGLGLTIWLTPYYPHDFEGILNDMTKKQQWAFITLFILLALTAIIFSIKSTKKEQHSEKVSTGSVD